MARFLSRYTNYRLTVQVNGEELGTIRFQDGVFETENEDFINYLRRHPDFGVAIFEDKEPKQAEKRPRNNG